MSQKILCVNDLFVSTNDKLILRGIGFQIGAGEVHAIMGPNGSGKSTFAYTLMGHPSYSIDSGKIFFADNEINDLEPSQRAKLGMFLAFQYPLEVEGIRFIDFLRQAYNAIHGGTEKQIGLKAFKALVEEKMNLLKIEPDFIERSLNFGFSGGEKKRAEMLQLAVLQPKLAILDEIDSGLDIDALKTVCECLNIIKKDNPSISIILITHYQRILNHFKPDFVHVLQNGNVIKSGDATLAQELEHSGYNIFNNLGKLYE